MIDIGKYEGHLVDKAVEDNSQVWVWKNWMLKNAETIEQHRATAALLNDAPLLLEEVKRLYELHALVGVPITWKVDYGDGGGYETFVADAVEWNYDDSGEWGLVNYNETRWMTLETAKEWMKKLMI